MVQDKGKLVHATPANELTEKLFGIESVVAKTKVSAANATTFILNSNAVPAGKIWNITYIAARNESGATTSSMDFIINHDGTNITFYSKVGSTAQWIWLNIPVDLYLDAGDYMACSFTGVTVGNNCRLNIFGYEMNAP